MLKNHSSTKPNSFHFVVGPKSKPPTTSPYEKNDAEEINETILKTQNKASDINRNLSEVFNNISTKTKMSRPEKTRSLTELDPNFLFENFEEIFEIHQTSHEETYKQLQQAQSNIFIIKNLRRAFDDAAAAEIPRNEEGSIYYKNKKTIERKNTEEWPKPSLNQSVFEPNKAKILATNEYYKNFLTKLTESHCEGCSCLNCKVFAVVSQKSKPKIDDNHRRMKTEIFQIKEEDFISHEEKEFQQPTSNNFNNFESDASMILKESLKSVSFKDNNHKKDNESNQSKNKRNHKYRFLKMEKKM